jgi:hypothetical protein
MMKGRCCEHAHQLFRGGIPFALLPRTRETLMAQTPLPLRFREAPDVPVIGLHFFSHGDHRRARRIVHVS